MIQKGELRTGNYISWHNHIMKVDDLIKRDAICISPECMGGKGRRYVEYQQMCGIPITNEILEKCKGFDYIRLVGGYCNEHHVIYECNGYWEFHPFCTNDKDCRLKLNHVHQLQNLCFALTQQELSITL